MEEMRIRDLEKTVRPIRALEKENDEGHYCSGEISSQFLHSEPPVHAKNYFGEWHFFFLVSPMYLPWRSFMSTHVSKEKDDMKVLRV